MNHLESDQEAYFQQAWSDEQLELKEKLVLEDRFDWVLEKDHPKQLRFVGGVDISFVKGDEETACASLVVLAWPSLEIVYRQCQMVKMTLPYIAGFLAFREVDHLVNLVQELKRDQPDLLPQVILVDGNGILHPRGFGLASHLGVLTGIPTVGVGKNFLVVDGFQMTEVKKQVEQNCPKKGDFYKLVGDKSGICWGVGLSMSDGGKRPLYISQGHLISLETAIELVKECCRHRIPEPIRQADLGSREYLRNHVS